MTEIIGWPRATVEQAKNWAKARGAHRRFIDIAGTYWELGHAIGIRPEVAYAQAAKETAFGNYGGVVSPNANNWAGIKTREGGANEDADAHESFDTPEDGVRAHFNHLAAYTGLEPIGSPHGRYFLVVSLDWAGEIETVEELGGKWAPNTAYGESIVNDYLTSLMKAEGGQQGINIIEKNHKFERGFRWRRQTDWLIFHHVGPMPESAVTSETVHRWHLSRGWNGIGYHAVILPSGEIEEGRPMAAQGAHTRGMNSASIGVLVVGDFTQYPPSYSQIHSAIEFGKWIHEKNPGIKIAGHEAFVNTECPGHLFPIDRIRDGIKGGSKVEREELSWQQKQTIGELQKLGDMGLLNDTEQHIQNVEKGEGLEDFVFITLISRIAQEIKED